MKCNGCGGEFPDRLTRGVLAYGGLSIGDGLIKTTTDADYTKTLCPRCQHVMKDILLSSDLSEHWEKYEWELMGDEYVHVEEYEND